MHTVRTATFQTPHGHSAVMEYRDGTSDWNTIAACLRNPLADTGDEYHLPQGLSGWALDVGAHIGSVTVGLLFDNPELRVVAIEAVPPNVDLMQRNLAANGLTERATVVLAAAWRGVGSKTVEFNYRGSEVAEVHAFIGSITPWTESKGHDTATIPIITLAQALKLGDGRFVWVKSDCEGCEHPFLRGPALRHVGHIEGEWHTRDGSPESFAAQLSKTHVVTWGQGIGGGPFVAVPR